jgi:hypothetical protein
MYKTDFPVILCGYEMCWQVYAANKGIWEMLVLKELNLGENLETV